MSCIYPKLWCGMLKKRFANIVFLLFQVDLLKVYSIFKPFNLSHSHAGPILGNFLISICSSLETLNQQIESYRVILQSVPQNNTHALTVINELVSWHVWEESVAYSLFPALASPHIFVYDHNLYLLNLQRLPTSKKAFSTHMTS